MLSAKNLGLAGGILWGAVVFVFTFVWLATGYAGEFLVGLAGVYPGYSLTVGGAFIGGIYGFIDAFIMFYILAWLYNKFQRQ